MAARTMLLSDRARVPSFFLLSSLIGVPRLFTLTDLPQDEALDLELRID